MGDYCYSQPMLDRVLRRAELLDRVMEHVGVDAGVAARVDKGAAFYEARIKCMLCCQERACRTWLDGGEGHLSPPDFCPNAEFFQSCAVVR
jgi:hypothetical protein